MNNEYSYLNNRINFGIVVLFSINHAYIADDFSSKAGQYKITKTKNKPGKTIRDTLSISRHIIFSTPVSTSVQATERMLCLRFALVAPPFP